MKKTRQQPRHTVALFLAVLTAFASLLTFILARTEFAIVGVFFFVLALAQGCVALCVMEDDAAECGLVDKFIA